MPPAARARLPRVIVEHALLPVARVPGFRGSAEYQQWRRLLHEFYEPFPTVEHFVPVAQV